MIGSKSNSSRRRILPWEFGVDGKTGYTQKDRLALKSPGFNLKLIAISKAFDVTTISAGFGGNVCVFEPWAFLLIDNKSDFTFAGAYQQAFETSPGEPQLCIRFCRWTESDYRQFAEAEDKAVYILGRSRFVFTPVSSLHLSLQVCSPVSKRYARWFASYA